MHKMKLEVCPHVCQEHLNSARQFAHVFHKRNTICVVPQIDDLPQSYMLGIIIHELGHVACAHIPHTEAQADLMAQIISGVEVQRRDYRKLKNLEYVAPADIEKARRFLARYVEIAR